MFTQEGEPSKYHVASILSSMANGGQLSTAATSVRNAFVSLELDLSFASFIPFLDPFNNHVKELGLEFRKTLVIAYKTPECLCSSELVGAFDLCSR